MILLVTLLGSIAVASPAAYAVPAPYPAEPPAASVSDGTVPPGGMVTFSGGGFLPYEHVSITVAWGGSDNAALYRPRGGFVLAARRTTLSATADGKGYFSISVRLSGSGTATLKAVGLTSGVTVTSTVEVAPTPSASNSGADHDTTGGGGGGDGDDVALPKTGPSVLLPAAGGAGAILIGIVLLRVARTRRRDRRDLTHVPD